MILGTSKFRVLPRIVMAIRIEISAR